MSSALNADFFGKEVILYTASGVVWTGGRQVHGPSWKQVLSLAEQLGLDIRKPGGSVVGEIRIKPASVVIKEDAPVEKAPAESMDKATRAKFIRGCNIIERFLDRETADLARYSMEMDAVVNWVMRLTEFSEAPQATLSVADAWLDEMCPSVEPEPVAPSRIKFGCEHCGFMGVCDCVDEMEYAGEFQAYIDDEAFDEYIVAEDDGPRVIKTEMVEMVRIATTATSITWDPRSNDILVDGKYQPGTMSFLAEILRDAGGWRWVSRGDYELNRWTHDERHAAQVSAAAAADPEPVAIEAEPHKMVVVLTPHGIFDYRDEERPHIRSYPKGWHIGRLYARLMERNWHVVEEDKFKGVIRHLTLSKLTHA